MPGSSGTIATAAVAAGASVATGVTVLGLGVVASGLLIGGAVAGIGFLTRASIPSSPSFDSGPAFKSIAGRVLQVRQPITARRTIYGKQRVSGPVLYMATTSNNRFLHLIIGLAGHEIEAIDDVLFNDVVIHSADLDGSGEVIGSGFYSGHARIKKHLGTTAQAADSDLVSEVAEWTTSHRLREIAYLYVRLDYDQDTYPTGIPAISAWVKGKKFLDTRDSVTRWSPNPALCLRDYLTDSRFGLGAAAGEIDDTFIDAAANVCDEMVGTEDLAVTVASVDTAADTLDLTGDLPLPLQTGDRGQATTTGTLPAGLSLATDYFVIVTQRRAAGQIQVATTYANAIAGTAIDLTDAGSGTHTFTKNAEPRYTANGFFSSEQTPAQTIADLLSAMAGRAANSGGTWRIRAGAWAAPTLTFDEGDMRGAIKVQTRHARRSRFNAVRGVYASPINSGIPTDYPPVTNATYQTADKDERLWRDLDLPFTSRPHTAQRLAKIELERFRQEISVALPVNLTGLQLEVGDTMNLDNTRLGWSGWDFEVVNWGLVIEEDASGAPLLGVDLGLRETASAVYDWASGEETTVDPAPNTTLPDPFTAAPPTELTLTSGTAALFLKGDGTVLSRIKASWTAPADQFVVSGGRIEVQFKKSADVDWQAAGLFPGDVIEAFVWEVEDGIAYDLRARAINHIGVRSDTSDPWTATVTRHVVVGKTAPPTDVSSLFVEETANNTRRFIWTHSGQDIDLAGFRVKANRGQNTAWAGALALHTGLITESSFETFAVNAGTWTVMVKAVDTTGNESLNAAVAVVNLGDAIEQNLIQTSDYRAVGFPGTIINGAVDGDGSLLADDTGDFMWATSGIPFWSDDADPMWLDQNALMFSGDGVGMWTADDLLMWTAIFPELRYTDTFTPIAAGLFFLQGRAQGGIRLFYRRQYPDSMWADEDTLLMWTDSSALMWRKNTIYVPYTNRVQASVETYAIRGVVPSSRRQGRITMLKANLDMPDIVERLDDIAIGAGGTRLSLARTFAVISNIALTVQDDGGSAVSVRTKDKNVLLGPLIECLNTSGALTAGTIDAVVQGY